MRSRFWSILTIFIGGVFIQFNFTHTFGKDIKELDAQFWKASNEVNNQLRIRHCIVHYDKTTSAKLLRKMVKETPSVHYVALHDVSTATNVPWIMERTIHIYYAKVFQPLKDLIMEQTELSKFDHLHLQKQQMGLNVWLVHAIDRRREQNLTRTLKHLPLSFDTHIFEFYREPKALGTNLEEITIRDIYKIDENSKEIATVNYGVWTPNKGLRIVEPNVWIRRSNFKGHQLRISSHKWWLSQTEIKDGCTSKECFKGINPDILFALQLAMNFTFIVKWEQPTGRRLENGSWTNQIGLALEGKVDFAMSHFGMTPQRQTVMNYIMASKGGEGRIYIRNPIDSIDWTVYGEPLVVDAWIGVAAFCVLVPLLMAVSVYSIGNDQEKRTWRISDCFNFLFKSLIMLGSDMRNDTLRARISCVTILVAGMLLWWLWEAMMISYFAVPSKAVPFNTIEEFLTKSDKKLIVRKGALTESVFRDSKDPIKQQIWKERIEPYINEPIYEAGPCATLDYLLEDDSYASYVNYGGLPECDSFYNCKIVVTPFVVNKIPGGGWMFPKRSPFFSIFNQYFIELEASGVFLRISDFWNEKSHLPSQVCPSYDGTAIKIDKIISLFVLSAGGVVLSVLIFLIEVLLPGKWLKKTGTLLDKLNRMFQH